MKIDIKAVNIKLTPAITDFISEKIGSLEKFIKPAAPGTRVWVEIGVTTRGRRKGDIFRTEILIRLFETKKVIRIEAEKDDLYAAIDSAKDEAKRRISQTKKHKMSRILKGARLLKSKKQKE